MRLVFLVLLLQLGVFSAKAQFDLGIGGQVDFPLMFNKNVGDYNHTLGAFGPRLTVNYFPANGNFFPSATLHVTGIQLPLIRVEDLVVNMKFTQVNLVANVNLKKEWGQKAIYYGGGIGVSFLNGTGTILTDNGQTSIVSITTDSSDYIQRWMPVVRAGVEYVFPISQEKPLFAGIGAQLQYIYFFDGGDKYNVSLVNRQYQQIRLQPQLYGHVINPGVYLNVYYRFKSKYSYY